MDGKFTLSNVPSSAKTLVVSFIGMATQEVAIKQTVNITLKSDAEVLEEVVVTGYGVQRKASFTGAAAIIGEDVIAKKSDANFVKALEGAVPGVQMSNSTSMPGVWSEIYPGSRVNQHLDELVDGLYLRTGRKAAVFHILAEQGSKIQRQFAKFRFHTCPIGPKLSPVTRSLPMHRRTGAISEKPFLIRILER